MNDFIYRPRLLDDYFDKILYINLQNDTDRNQRMIEQFNSFGIKNYERVEAIRLSNINAIEQKFYRNFNKRDAKYVIGSLSCRASHIECVKLAVHRNYKKILILEDDVLFLKNPNVLLSVNYEILNSWDMLYFGGLVEPFFRNQIVCAHAYALNKSVFDDILNMAESSGMEIDNFYAKVLQHMSYNNNQSGKYNIQIINPFNQIIQNKGYLSNIQSI